MLTFRVKLNPLNKLAITGDFKGTSKKKMYQMHGIIKEQKVVNQTVLLASNSIN